MKSKQTRSNVIRIDDLLTFDAVTENQKIAKEAWRKGDNLVMYGSAGTGKTFMSMYLALEDVLDKGTEVERLVIVRSVVPTREMGYLPGSVEEKTDAYTAPYRGIATELFNDKEAYDKMESNGSVEFLSTSFIRGTTFDNCVILVDECQNCNFHELDSIITRVGRNTRIIFSGDYYQSDFKNENERNGFKNFLRIIEQLKNFSCVEFNWSDIVRSDFVRDYIMTKELLGVK